MRLLELTVENFGQYGGAYTFDLTTPQEAGAARNMVLFRGHNGAGKSTLFTAIALALHGRHMTEERSTSQQYNDYLLARLHRRRDHAKNRTVNEDHGRVGVRMEFIQSGRPMLLNVERTWQRNGSIADERLTLTREDKPLDIEPSEYQSWLNELFPPGLAPICFFDAERLDALASSERQSQQVVSMLRRLLGLEFVERLQEDLKTYAFKMGGMENLRALQEDVTRLQGELDALSDELKQTERRAEELAEQEDRVQAELAGEERRLTAEGGSYAARKPVWQARLDVVRKEREELEGQLRELCGGLLPFALAPDLCLRLSQRLTRERYLQKRQVAAELWEGRAARLREQMQQATLWENISIAEDAQQQVTARLLLLLQQPDPNDGEDNRMVHRLASLEQEQLQTWIGEVVHGVPSQSRLMGERLRELQEEQTQLEANLQRVPDEAGLSPYQDAVAYQEQRLATAKAERAQQAELVGAARFQTQAKTREFDQAVRQWEAAAMVERQMALATRSRLALRKYQEKLIAHRLVALQERLAENFNHLCQKDRLLPETIVNPSDFRIELRDTEGQPFSVNDLSAGERQLYTLALLQALRQVSGQNLPLLIDTPLARLDERHRTLLAQEYFPLVSTQVLLFATDAELDAPLMVKLEPHIAYSYAIRFNEERQRTQVEPKLQTSTWDRNFTARSA